jgi:hypothetical protein
MENVSTTVVSPSVQRARRPLGDRHWTRRHPERMPRADRHWSRRMPERRAWGDRNGSRKHPDRQPRGERIGNSKLVTQNVIDIRRRYAYSDVSMYELARQFGVSRPMIGYIVRRNSWAHVE